MKNNYVWYACYGSNLLKKRFLCYITGGQIEGASTMEPGCKDKTLPLDDQPFIIHHQLFFSGHFTKWDNKGVAFIDARESEDARTLGRIYLITTDQFLDVVRQENAFEMDYPIDLFSKDQNKDTILLPGNYGKMICLGEKNGYPIYSFTCPERPEDRGFDIPSKAYTDVIGRGIKETYSYSEEEVERYFNDIIMTNNHKC